MMEYKQIIAVRNDLAMSKGKLAAQVAHASHSAAIKTMEHCPRWYDEWWGEGQKKVVVKVQSDKELYTLYEDVRGAEIPCYLINDAGLTELAPGTTTALGIGPAPNHLLDKFTGHLKLL